MTQTKNSRVNVLFPFLDIIIITNKKHLKNVGPIRHCEAFYIAIHQVLLLSHAACASMSTTTTTTTTTTSDRGDRYGPIKWAQLNKYELNT